MCLICVFYSSANLHTAKLVKLSNRDIQSRCIKIRLNLDLLQLVVIVP